MSDSDSDWEFQEIACVTCEQECIGKSMCLCTECDGKICQICKHIKIGCEYDDETICVACYEANYDSQPQWCQDKGCNCSNKQPRGKTDFDVEEWKQHHAPIDYKSVHNGKYLIDLYLSSNSFEHGYIDWVLGNLKSPQPNFQRIINEAKEIKALFEN